MTVELSAVEYDHSNKAYLAIFSNGDQCHLEASNLRDAELEAQRIVEHSYITFGEYTRFVGVKDWE